MADLTKQAGARLKLARMARGLSIRALAQETGIGHTDISKVERGRGTSLERYALLADSLGLAFVDLFAVPRRRVSDRSTPHRAA
jgi:transcriptional regulator with XRE-family HTH domain